MAEHMKYKLTVTSDSTGVRATFERVWQCWECKDTIYHSYLDLANVGNPVCDKCDRDMELL